MPLDAYSFCPGGTGKKIKFCCPDFLGELQKIERMLEGEQYLACGKHVDQLLQKHPDRACLLSTKIVASRASGQMEQAAAAVAAFIEKHPENPDALAESAVQTAVDQGGREAVAVLQQAMDSLDKEMSLRLYEAMGTVAEVLLSEGQWSAARALWQLQSAIARDDPRPVDMLIAMNGSPSVPLLRKEDPQIGSPPDDAPWKARYEETLAPLATGNWQATEKLLAPLAEEVGDSPLMWRNLATLRGWLADSVGSAEALRKYAALDIPPEDAVEAEALAMFLSELPLDDPIEMIKAEWTVGDFEQLQTALAADPRAVPIPFDLSSFSSEGSPPPKAAYLLLDRPVAEKSDEVNLEKVSRVFGQAMLYGRETDREARLEVIGVLATDLSETKSLIAEIAVESVGAEVAEDVMATTSASTEIVERKWHPPKDTTQEELRKLSDEYVRDGLMNRWGELKLGALDGKSPREATALPEYAVKLAAAVMVLEFLAHRGIGDFDLNELRTELGVPTLDPIDPSQIDLATLPLVRLVRVEVEKVAAAGVLIGFQRASAFGAIEAAKKFAQAVVDQPSLADRPERLTAYRTLAQTAGDPVKTLEYIEQGRQATLTQKQSCAPWDLMELPIRMALRQPQEATRLANHVQSHHIEEPGVAEALMRFLVQIGAVRPDGTPAPQPAAAAMAPAEPAEEPGKIWTPDGDQPGGEKKLWTPD